MVMFFRMALAMLTYRRRGRLAVLGTGVLTMRCWPNDLDLNMHMNNGRYFSAADIGRMDWWFRTGVWNAALRLGVRPLAGDASARFSRSLLPFERFELQSRLLGWNEKWMFAEHRFVTAGKVVATVVVRYLFKGSDKRCTPEEVLRAAGHGEPSPPLPDWVLGWHQAQDRLSQALKAG